MRYLASNADAERRLSTAKDASLILYVDAEVNAWCRRKQILIASFIRRELLWLRQLFKRMNIPVRDLFTIFEGDQSCIKLIPGSTSARSKRIDVCYHQMRDLLQKKTIEVLYNTFQQRRR